MKSICMNVSPREQRQAGKTKAMQDSERPASSPWRSDQVSLHSQVALQKRILEESQHLMKHSAATKIPI